MTDASRSPGTHDLSFTVTLSAEPAFADTAGALAARAGDFAGCGSDDARRLGDAVREAFARLAATAPVSEHVDLVVHGTGRVVRIDLCCLPPDTAALQQRLAGHDTAEPLQALVDRVEFGAEGAHCYCRLTQQVRPSR